MSSLLQFPTLPHTEIYEIQDLVEDQLRQADVFGILPTPLHAVMESLGIRRDDDLAEMGRRYGATRPSAEAGHLRRALSKVRGMADLDRRALYLPPLESLVKNFWRDAHELSHVTFSWHRLHEGTVYGDDKNTLCERAYKRLECEANFGANSYIFQPSLFSVEANDCNVNFQNILVLSERYGASIKATFLAFVRARVDDCVGITYMPSRVKGEDGLYRLHKPWVVTSSSFDPAELDWEPPQQPRTDWAMARASNACAGGEARMLCGETAFILNGLLSGINTS